MKQEQKKKILYIITKSVWAGAGKYVYDLATGLPADRFEILVAAGGRGKLVKKLEKADIACFDIKNFQRDVSFLKEILAFFEITTLLFRTRPNIVHVSSSKAGGVAGIALFFYRLITLRLKLNTIFTAHGWAFAEKRSGFQVTLIRFFSRLTCLFYKKIICVSKFDHQLAIKNQIARKKKLVTIHNGIKLDEYEFLTKEKARQQLGNSVSKLDAGGLWIGTIGEFTRNKGQGFLIETAKKLKIEDWKLKIVLIGFGEELENLKLKIKDLKLEESVFLVDNLPEASGFLKAFDVFVLPSLKEGLPYTLLEAGLARLPVVASNVGGVPEIIDGEKTGLLVEPENSEKIKEGIEKILENPELKSNLSYNLWEKIHQEFRFEQMLKKTADIYH